MATVSSAIWDTAGVTAFQALQAPFLITNYSLEGAVITGDIGKSMIESADQQAGDVHVLAIHEGGLRKPFGKTPLVTLANWKGKTIRAPQSQVLADGLKALGANVDPLPLPDVTQALQSGTIDGVEANLPLIYTQQWYEQAKNVTGNVNLWPFPTVLVINKAVWDGLSADQQNALTTAAGNIGARVAQDLHDPGQHGRPGPRELRRQVPVRHRRRQDPADERRQDGHPESGPREPGLRHPDPGPCQDPAAPAGPAGPPHGQDRGVRPTRGVGSR